MKGSFSMWLCLLVFWSQLPEAALLPLARSSPGASCLYIWWVHAPLPRPLGGQVGPTHRILACHRSILCGHCQLLRKQGQSPCSFPHSSVGCSSGPMPAVCQVHVLGELMQGWDWQLGALPASFLISVPGALALLVLAQVPSASLQAQQW